ncbi:MAG: hypothetical protein HKN43_17370 [Rhodothermales bacterium]|nr:hypothetical protein [Rhodothermales bacterium]
MSLYAARQATLGEIDGSGYAFLKRSSIKGQYQGVFFVESELKEQLESLTGEESVSFTGVVYTKNRSGGVRENRETVEVDVYNLVSVGVGARADFRVVESD